MNFRSLARLFRDMTLNDLAIDYASGDTPSILTNTDDIRLLVGNGTNSFDLRWYGNVATDYFDWDASASKLSVAGAAVFDVPAGQLQIGSTAVTATAAELNAAADVSARLVVIADATPYAVLAANSGRPHIIPELTNTTTFTLPTAATGLEYTFYSKGVATEAQNWIFDTGAAAAFYLGGLSFIDLDAGAGADEVHAGVYPNGSSNDIMTIVTPAAGTTIHVLCDGTNWIVRGQVVSATIPTFTDT